MTVGRALMILGTSIAVIAMLVAILGALNV